jgi:hypothetical protein
MLVLPVSAEVLSLSVEPQAFSSTSAARIAPNDLRLIMFRFSFLLSNGNFSVRPYGTHSKGHHKPSEQVVIICISMKRV